MAKHEYEVVALDWNQELQHWNKQFRGYPPMNVLSVAISILKQRIDTAAPQYRDKIRQKFIDGVREGLCDS